MENKNTLNLTIPIPPSINNGYLKPRAFMQYNPKTKKMIPMAQMYETKEAKDFKRHCITLLKREVERKNFKPNSTKSFFFIEWTWFFKTVKNDTNNRLKVPIDSISEFGDKYENLRIWEDDNLSMNIDKRIYYDTNNPRVELELYEAPFIGIFDNQEDLDNFISTYCNNCKKGNKIGQKGGCSIYKKATQSRIQEEIDINFETGEKICNKIKNK